MTFLRFLLIFESTIWCCSSFGQNNVKVYSGVSEKIGLGFEYFVNQKISLEFRTSFNSNRRTGPQLIGYSDSAGLNWTWLYGNDVWNQNNFFFNLYAKKYVSKKLNQLGLYYGIYLRTKLNYEKITESNWNTQELDYANKNKVIIQFRILTPSWGFHIGYKGKITKKFGWEIITGGGFNTNFMSPSRSVYYDGSNSHQLKSWSENYFNLLGQVSINYRFLKNSKSQ